MNSACTSVSTVHATSEHMSSPLNMWLNEQRHLLSAQETYEGTRPDFNRPLSFYDSRFGDWIKSTSPLVDTVSPRSLSPSPCFGVERRDQIPPMSADGTSSAFINWFHATDPSKLTPYSPALKTRCSSMLSTPCLSVPREDSWWEQSIEDPPLGWALEGEVEPAHLSPALTSATLVSSSRFVASLGAASTLHVSNSSEVMEHDISFTTDTQPKGLQPKLLPSEKKVVTGNEQGGQEKDCSDKKGKKGADQSPCKADVLPSLPLCVDSGITNTLHVKPRSLNFFEIDLQGEQNVGILYTPPPHNSDIRRKPLSACNTPTDAVLELMLDDNTEVCEPHNTVESRCRDDCEDSDSEDEVDVEEVRSILKGKNLNADAMTPIDKIIDMMLDLQLPSVTGEAR